MKADPDDPFYRLGALVGKIICIILAATLIALILNYSWKVLQWAM